MCGVDTRVEARDHEEAQGGEHDGAFMATGGSEGAVAFERRRDDGRVRCGFLSC